MRFARAFSMVRTVMRRATPPAALGLIATNRYRPVQPCPRQGAPPPARLACAGSRTHTCPARLRAPWAILCPGALFHNFCAQIRAGLDDQSLLNEVLNVSWVRVLSLKMRCRGKNFFRGSVPDPVMRPHLWTHPPVGPVRLSPPRACFRFRD